MGKVVKMFNEQEAKKEALVEHIEDLLQAAKNGELKNILVAAENHNDEIITGYCNLDIGEKQYMLGHIQVDINFEIVKANVDQLIEIIE